MKLVSETTPENTFAIIISSEKFIFLESLKNFLEKNGVKTFYLPKTPINIKNFDYLFLINLQKNEVENVIKQKGKFKKIILIYIKNSIIAKELSIRLKKNKKIKIIDINDKNLTSKDIDNLLWFSFSKSEENYLSWEIFKPKFIEKKSKTNLFIFQSNIKNFTFKKIILIVFIFIIIIHFLFIPFCLSSLLINYKIIKDIKKENFNNIKKYITINSKILNIGYGLYQLVRPTYLFFSMAIFPDNAFDILHSLNQVYDKTYFSYLNSKIVLNFFLKSQKNEKEKEEMIIRLENLINDLKIIEKKIDTILNKTPRFIFKKEKNKIFFIRDVLSKINSLSSFKKEIFAENTEKKYLLFFANNRELRPGGGFIGSFAILTIKDYTFNEPQIYDVYDADGQLKIHVEPPMPIKKYLNVPHWYLRDSNFSPDFYENYQKGKFFLKEELGLENFDGGFLITTAAIEEILEGFGNIYLPDFRENINRDNFFIKTQMYAEKNFFPGSRQKKTFLSSLVRQLLINIENASMPILLKALKNMLDEKQIVVYFENQKLQKLMDNFFYSGRIIEPKCTFANQDCINDYLFFYDANLGINKADYYISKQIVYYIKIKSNGKITQNLTLEYLNNSPSTVFPGGIYRNYLQIILPKNIQINRITKDGVLIENFDIDQSNSIFNKVGIYFEIEPKIKTVIKLDYELKNYLKKDGQIYQLIIQKQIGAKNYDFVLDITLPNNISLINQNFIPLVRNKNIVYNFLLNSDKIFFIEFKKN